MPSLTFERSLNASGRFPVIDDDGATVASIWTDDRVAPRQFQAYDADERLMCSTNGPDGGFVAVDPDGRELVQLRTGLFAKSKVVLRGKPEHDVLHHDRSGSSWQLLDPAGSELLACQPTGDSHVLGVDAWRVYRTADLPLPVVVAVVQLQRMVVLRSQWARATNG